MALIARSCTIKRPKTPHFSHIYTIQSVDCSIMAYVKQLPSPCLYSSLFRYIKKKTKAFESQTRSFYEAMGNTVEWLEKSERLENDILIGRQKVGRTVGDVNYPISTEGDIPRITGAQYPATMSHFCNTA